NPISTARFEPVPRPLALVKYPERECGAEPRQSMNERLDITGHPEEAKVLEWLLEKSQPAVRYGALVDLLGRKQSDTDVRSTHSRIARVGWAYDQLRLQGPKGFWEAREPRNVKEWIDFLYFPVFGGTNWRALVLSDFGLDAANPRIKKIADLLFEYKLRLSSP